MDAGQAGRTVIVTGGTANIGPGIALAFAAANVVIAGRDQARGRRARERLLERGAKDALWHADDVTDRAPVDAIAEAVHRAMLHPLHSGCRMPRARRRGEELFA